MLTNSMTRPFAVGWWLLHKLPRNLYAAKIARAYLSWCRSENNVWAGTNGEFDLLRIVAPHCKVIIDVGANVGDWTREALKSNPTLEIHCFEAAPDNFATLQSSDLAGRVVMNDVAVSRFEGEINLTLAGANSPMNSTVVPSDVNAAGVVTVRAVTLDNYVLAANLGHVDYVKIDVEGAEMAVLEGMPGLLHEGGVDAVQFEYGPFSIYARTFIRDFFVLFEAANFSMHKISAPKLLSFPTYHEVFDNFSHQNWIAVRRGSRLASIVASSATAGILL